MCIRDRVWANAWDVFRRAPSRGGRGRRVAVDSVVCFGWGFCFRVFLFRFIFSSDAHGLLQVLSLIHISEPTRRYAISYAVFCLKKKNTKKSAAPLTHHEIRSNPATATTSRRRATKHVPRVSPYSPASIDPGFVEIDLVQLSQSVKMTNVTRTHTYRHIQMD